MSSVAKILIPFVVLVGLVFGWMTFEKQALAQTAVGDSFYLRLENENFGQAIELLGAKGVVKNPDQFVAYAKFQRKAVGPKSGTIEVWPGMTFDEVIAALQTPVRQMVRVPEGWWIKRTAARLEEKGVCKAEEYIDLANNPSEFKDSIGFTLPEDSLEGYLYPDTYDFPPQLGARRAILMQLKNFESRVIKEIGDGDLHRALTVGSMIETEAAVDDERPIVAGVIENRLKQNMRLQLDATVLYGLQEWRRLGAGEVNRVDSPYNTYKINGLPPGPICSPTIKSISAALNPASHNYLFYVRGEGLTHLFSSTYEEHLANIKKSNAIRAREAAR